MQTLLQRGNHLLTKSSYVARVRPAFRATTARQTLPVFRFNHSNATPTTTPKPQTEIEKLILGNVKATGPISFATYMQLCLAHPIHGYYMNSKNDVFGTKGDFITSPEISQAFGELVAIWFLSEWFKLPNRPPIRIVELGPGRGTLMADILRVIEQLEPDQPVNVHLVETSLAMRELQKAKLTGRNIKVHWHDLLGEIQPSAEEYTMLVAHEFFDALPFHVVQKHEDGWHEVLIAPSSEIESNSEHGHSQEQEVEQKSPVLQRVLSKTPTPISTVLGNSSERFRDLPTGSTIEVSATAFRLAHKIGQLLSTDTPLGDKQSLGGSGLIIDYGGDQVFEDSFRGFRNHKLVDVFHDPGNCDLTTNVDFAYLKEGIDNQVGTYGPISQRDFLLKMGLELRVKAVLEALPTEEKKEAFINAAVRLVDPEGMGEQYKVLGLTRINPGYPVWPFIDPTETEADPEVKEEQLMG